MYQGKGRLGTPWSEVTVIRARVLSMVKKIISIILLITLFLFSCHMPVYAQNTAMQFDFVLSIDGEDAKEVNSGDIITVTIRLKRTDAQEPYIMYSFQDEIRYDASFFELVEGGTIVRDGVSCKDVAGVDGFHEVYINFLSMGGGTQWEADTVLGSIQLKVIGEKGVANITNQDYIVSLSDGADSYPCEANDVSVICTTDCTVRFMTNGGGEIMDQIIPYGEKIQRPKDPVREGMQFVGWFTDIHLTDEWDFEVDVVKSNMSLYAKWLPEETADVEKAVYFAIEDYGVWFTVLVVIVCAVFIILLRQRRRK